MDTMDLTREPLLLEALKNRRQSMKERLAKSKRASFRAAQRAANRLWMKMRRQWSKDHPQYIFRKGRLIFVPPEKRRQLKSRTKGRTVMVVKLPGSGKHG